MGKNKTNADTGARELPSAGCLVVTGSGSPTFLS